ncbi:hypothetical protein BSIN_2936 [Burkholderia singularis]|uniref:Uncharacterized protein n=1 Tax=Burkholderia singularis TaxID=1503053 RepID=A0A238H3D4_9BURK|nr:hypothetical protein BSIN_2936 [Burkholderia singularis]
MHDDRFAGMRRSHHSADPFETYIGATKNPFKQPASLTRQHIRRAPTADSL